MSATSTSGNNFWNDRIPAFNPIKDYHLSPWFFQKQKVGRAAAVAFGGLAVLSLIAGTGGVATVCALSFGGVLVPVAIGGGAALIALSLLAPSIPLYRKSYYNDPAFLQKRRDAMVDCQTELGYKELQKKFGKERAYYPDILSDNDLKSLLKQDLINNTWENFHNRNGDPEDILTKQEKINIVYDIVKRPDTATQKGGYHSKGRADYSHIIDDLDEENAARFKALALDEFERLSINIFYRRNQLPAQWKEDFKALIDPKKFTSAKAFTDRYGKCLPMLFTQKELQQINYEYLAKVSFVDLIKNSEHHFMELFRNQHVEQSLFREVALGNTKHMTPSEIIAQFGIETIASSLITPKDRDNIPTSFDSFRSFSSAHGGLENILILHEKGFYTSELITSLIKKDFEGMEFTRFRGRYPGFLERRVVSLNESFLKNALLLEIRMTQLTNFLDRSDISGYETVVRGFQYEQAWKEGESAYELAKRTKQDQLDDIKTRLNLEKKLASEIKQDKVDAYDEIRETFKSKLREKRKLLSADTKRKNEINSQILANQIASSFQIGIAAGVNIANELNERDQECKSRRVTVPGPYVVPENVTSELDELNKAINETEARIAELEKKLTAREVEIEAAAERIRLASEQKAEAKAGRNRIDTEQVFSDSKTKINSDFASVINAPSAPA